MAKAGEEGQKEWTEEKKTQWIQFPGKEKDAS